MKKTIQLRWTPWLVSINAAVALLVGGCAAPEQHSFNRDFNENLPIKPNYYIQHENAGHFSVTVHQGTPSSEPERVINVKEAASTIAKSECQKLGWDKWHLNYIQERDQGWMHIVIAEVTRE